MTPGLLEVLKVPSEFTVKVLLKALALIQSLCSSG